MTIPTYKQQSPLTGKLVNSDNEVLDVQQFLESGQVLVSATSSADPVVPVAEATTPKYKNLAPWVGKFINSENDIIDLIEFLTSGQIKIQVDGGVAPTGLTYVTQTDETAILPDSVPLSALTSGILAVQNGTGNLLTRSIASVVNQTAMTNGNAMAGNPTIGLSSTLVFPGTISFGGSSATVNNIDNTGTSFLSTDTMTALAIQTAISNQIDMGTSFRGGWDASGGTFPTTGGTGTAGAIESGNWWFITVAGTLAGQDVSVGDEITALVNSPGQTGSNWLVSAQKVTSVFNRDGAVVAELGDYDIGKITNGINNTIAWVYSDVADGGAPLPSYDFTVGFLHGSFYRDSVTGYNYVCIDAGEDAAIWEKLCPTSASYTNNSLALNVNGNETNTEIVPLSPTNVTYLAANGNDATARVNSFAFPFSTLQSAADAITALADEIGNVLHIYSKSSGGVYGNLSLDGFNGWEILGFGDYVSAGDLYIADESALSFVSSAVISNIYWNNLSMTNYHDQVDGVTFRFGAFNDYVLENDASATNGLNSGNKFIDMEFVGGIIYFPSGYAKQITSITETYIGCKFGGTMTINGTATNVRFIACQNIPTIIYANGATSAQVTIVGVNSFNTRSGNVMPLAGDYSYDQITGLPSTATSGKLMRGTGSAWAETTATYPNTIAANDLLRGSATNVITPLSTQASSALTTSELGALRWTSLSLGEVAMGSFVSGVNAGTITGGTGMDTSISETSIVIGLDSAVDATVGQTNVTGATQALAINTTYYTTYAGLCVMNLPASANRNSVIEIISGPSTAQTFRVTQNAGQQIRYGAQNGVSFATTEGVSGYLQSIEPNTVLRLKCIVANTRWVVVNNVNNIDVV